MLATAMAAAAAATILTDPVEAHALAWTPGHTHACTTTVPATADGALVDYTMMLSHLDFAAADRVAIAGYLDASEYEAALDVDGTATLGVLARDVDPVAGTFRIFAKYDTSAVSATDIYWRFGAAVVHAVGEQVDVSTKLLALLSEDTSDASGNVADGTVNGGLAIGGVSGPDGTFNATNFDGFSKYIAMGDAWISNGPITYSFWNKVSVSVASVTGGVGDSLQDRIVAYYSFSDGNLYWDYGNDTVGRIVTDYGSANDEVWTHVALTSGGAGGSLQQIFINGVLALEDLSSTDGPDGAVAVDIGLASSLGGHNGSIASLSLSSQVRSAAWIKTDFKRQGTLGQATSTALTTLEVLEGTITAVTWNGNVFLEAVINAGDPRIVNLTISEGQSVPDVDTTGTGTITTTVDGEDFSRDVVWTIDELQTFAFSLGDEILIELPATISSGAGTKLVGVTFTTSGLGSVGNHLQDMVVMVTSGLKAGAAARVVGVDTENELLKLNVKLEGENGDNVTINRSMEGYFRDGGGADAQDG